MSMSEHDPPGENRIGEDEGNQSGIKVLVYVFDDLQRRTGRARIDVRLKPGTTLEGLFQHLGEQYDQRFPDVCAHRPGERSISVVLLNGHTLHLPRDLQRELKGEDVLHLIPPIAGG